jgi:hypothetical protein
MPGLQGALAGVAAEPVTLGIAVLASASAVLDTVTGGASSAAVESARTSPVGLGLIRTCSIAA